MSEITVAVVGASGYLAGKLIEKLEDKGISVKQFSHQIDSTKPSSSLYFDIDKPKLPENPDFDHLVYFSWKLSRSRKAQTAAQEAAIYVARWSFETKVRSIFISSMAAYPEKPTSNYGIAKKQSESEFVQVGGDVIRPATIVGDLHTAGSALLQLENLPRPAVFLLRALKPIPYPTLTLSKFNETLYDRLINPRNAILNLSDSKSTIQERFNLKSGIIPISLLKRVSHVFPSKIGDRVLTLIDLSENSV